MASALGVWIASGMTRRRIMAGETGQKSVQKRDGDERKKTASQVVGRSWRLRNAIQPDCKSSAEIDLPGPRDTSIEGRLFCSGKPSASTGLPGSSTMPSKNSLVR